MKKKVLVSMFLLVLIFSLMLSTTAYAKEKPTSEPNQETVTPNPGGEKNPEETGCNSNNPKNCPDPETICGQGNHIGNPHCSDQTVDPTTGPTIDPTVNPTVDPSPDPTQTPDPTEPPTPTETVTESLVVGQAIIPVTGDTVCPCCDMTKVDIMSMDGFEFQTWYQVTINSQKWAVAVYQGTAEENNLVITEECFCSPFVVNPELDKTITLAVISPEGVKSVTEISVEIQK